MTDAIVLHPPTALAELQEIAVQARDYASQSRSDRTRHEYRADWANFTS